jgi:hypothetical protein
MSRRRDPRALRATALLLAGWVGVLAAGRARADGAWVKEIRDGRGRVVAVVPRQHTSISMTREVVALVPYHDPAAAKDHPLLFVNVRYTFDNPGPATTLSIGFPELLSKVHEERYGYERPEAPKGSPCGTRIEDDEADGLLSITCPETIERFWADVAGRPVAVRALPGKGDYRRWFVFKAGFGASGPLQVRNLYVARLGYTRRQSNTSASMQYRAGYILHTGSSWSGAIGAGEVGLWRQGAWQLLKRFTSLRPGKKDDVSVALDLTQTESLGRPLIEWDYGNGQQAESVLPRFEPLSAVSQSSSLEARGGGAAKGARHLGPMVVDQDPGTAWIDGGPKGGVGQWVQLPTARIGRIRGLQLRGGATRPGVSRVKRLRLGCYDLQGNRRRATLLEQVTVTLQDRAGQQRVLLPRPLGECFAVRLTIEALHGAADSHGTIAEVGFVH